MIPEGPMTEHEQFMASQLAACKFLPGSFQKRFAYSMAGYEGSLTKRQRWYLYFLVHRYRKQIGSDIGNSAGYWLANHKRPEKQSREKKQESKQLKDPSNKLPGIQTELFK